MGSAALAKDLAKYEELKPSLVEKAEGKYVLIHDGKEIGVFDTCTEALKTGYERFGNVPFFVKQIMAVEIPANFVSNLLAI